MPTQPGAKTISEKIWSSMFKLAGVVTLTAMCFPLTGNPQAPTTSPESSATDDNPEQEIDKQTLSGNVTVDGTSVLTVYQSISGLTPQERADKIAERIIKAARDPDVLPESVALEPRDGWTDITAGGKFLMAVTAFDAKAARKSVKQLAIDNAGNIRQCILNYRREHNWHSIFRDILYTFCATLLLLPIAWLVRKLRLWLGRRLEKWIQARTEREEKKTAWQVSFTYFLSVLMSIGAVVRWLFLITLLQIYISIVLSFFPQTRHISRAIIQWVLEALSVLGNSAVAYIPNLFIIAVVGVIASQVIRLISVIFGEIGNGNLKLGSFYPEWAEPTAKLIRMLVLVLVVIIIFPYLPGSKSPAFQGISIFVGVLLSLGSSSAVANAVAGVILTYMRSFAVGDWVRIGDALGAVVERNMLVTRILTPKQEILTIPNASVMSGSVMNYTREAKNAGVIFHTTITIGYDVPWRTVHQLLIDAALATERVLHVPKPFVLQTALNDFYVAYELNAYTDVPTEMQFIYSHLHQNIQDRFNEAGVEICSPHFAALRDGNKISIPDQYIAADYAVPAFRIDGSEKKKDVTETTGQGR
jgi:small-conductance mechanosensitive channel